MPPKDDHEWQVDQLNWATDDAEVRSKHPKEKCPKKGEMEEIMPKAKKSHGRREGKQDWEGIASKMRPQKRIGRAFCGLLFDCRSVPIRRMVRGRPRRQRTKDLRRPPHALQNGLCHLGIADDGDPFHFALATRTRTRLEIKSKCHKPHPRISAKLSADGPPLSPSRAHPECRHPSYSRQSHDGHRVQNTASKNNVANSPKYLTSICVKPLAHSVHQTIVF